MEFSDWLRGERGSDANVHIRNAKSMDDVIGWMEKEGIQLRHYIN